MDSQEIVRAFLSSGFTLSPDSLDFFSKNPAQIGNFLEKVKSLRERPRMLTMDAVGGLLSQVASVQPAQANGASHPYSVEQMAQYFSKRYASLSRILSARMDLVNLISINKVSPKLKKFSLICMVGSRDRELKTISAEDTSGSVTVSFPDSLKEDFRFVVEDEVLGLVCTYVDNEIVAEKIVWPDIPLRKDVSRSEQDIDVLALSASDIEAASDERYAKLASWVQENASRKTNVVLFVGERSQRTDDFIKNMPSGWKVYETTGEDASLDISGVKIFATSGGHIGKYESEFSSETDAAVLALLRKRHMNPSFRFNPHVGNDDSILEAVPDVVAVAKPGKPGVTNYKGTTVVMNGSMAGEPIYHIVNLKTRETIKIDLT
jgi:DNA polymerase II small subunit/DNA polymerase delta subunit B